MLFYLIAVPVFFTVLAFAAWVGDRLEERS